MKRNRIRSYSRLCEILGCKTAKCQIIPVMSFAIYGNNRSLRSNEYCMISYLIMLSSSEYYTKRVMLHNGAPGATPTARARATAESLGSPLKSPAGQEPYKIFA